MHVDTTNHGLGLHTTEQQYFSSFSDTYGILECSLYLQRRNDEQINGHHVIISFFVLVTFAPYVYLYNVYSSSNDQGRMVLAMIANPLGIHKAVHKQSCHL